MPPKSEPKKATKPNDINNNFKKRKLDLSENIKAALSTQYGAEKEHLQEMWNGACSESGN